MEVKCQICEKEIKITKSIKQFTSHITRFHKESIKSYYDKYIKKENEGICKVCKKPTNFFNLENGYRIYCSKKCINLDSNCVKKAKNTYLERTGYKHNSLNPESINKRKKTCIKRYGVDEYRKSDKCKNESKKLWENFTNEDLNEINKKRQKTCQERYGVSNPFQMVDRVQAGCIESFGYNNSMKHPELKLKPFQNFEKTKKEKYEKVRKKLMKRGLEKIKKLLPADYEIVEYRNTATMIIKCNKGHEFEIQRQLISLRYNRGVTICTTCNPNTNLTQSQNKVSEFIREIYNGKILNNHRKTLYPKYEIDVFIPDMNLGFEFNGLYFHSSLNRPKNYHLDKTNFSEDKNIHLIHIFEDDWRDKQEIVKSRIKSVFGIYDQVIYARKCIIKQVSYNDSINFLNENHLQGFCTSKYRYGLYYNDVLVSIITFGSLRKNLGYTYKDNEFELLRFCSIINTKVVGAASRLFKYFIKTIDPKIIISYADRSWSTILKDNIYDKLGFIKNKTTEPNYWYIIKNKRENRFKYRKSELIKQGFDSNKTEEEIMLEQNIYRIYDCGSIKYQWKQL